MPELKIIQLQHESDTWKRLLTFMMEENVRLKHRLSEVLKAGFAKDMLEALEDFQTDFVKEDSIIRTLRQEIAQYDKLLVKETFLDGQIAGKVMREMKKIRKDVGDAEKMFGTLKCGFNSYLSENI